MNLGPIFGGKEEASIPASARMFRSKIRIHTCQVILLTSLVWFLVDVMVLMFYSDCINGSGWNCQSVDSAQHDKHHEQQHDELFDESERRAEALSMQQQQQHDPNARTFKPGELKLWRPAKVVRENRDSPGEMGKAVHIPPEQDAIQQELFKLNQFNLMASDMISLNRSLKDVRLSGCKNKKFPKLLPDTSIVIVFHNEAWSTLLRTVWSVINRSPKALLKEIILVDDASERGKHSIRYFLFVYIYSLLYPLRLFNFSIRLSDHLKQKLEDYVEKLPVPTYVYRTEKRSGLIRARLLGAKHVKGQVITFLDAHCECTEGWLEPLLSRIAHDKKTVVCPIIDVISDDTFEYITASDMTWGGFNWKLNFRW